MDPLDALKAEVHRRCQDNTAAEDVLQMERMIELMADGVRDENTIIFYTMLLDQADYLTEIAEMIRTRLVTVELADGASGDAIEDYRLHIVDPQA
jgi:hypothetical protein